MIMGKYILNDFKRAMGSKWTRIYLLAGLVLILLANIAVICFRFIYGSNEGTFAYNVFEYASWCFLIPYYSCIVIGDIAIGRGADRTEQAATKLKPWQYYISKLVIAIMLAVCFFAAAFITLYVVTALFHINEGVIPWMVIRLFFSKAVVALPLWFAGICFAIMFLMLFEKRMLAYGYFALLVFVIPQCIRIFSLDSFKFEFFRLIRRYTITQSFGLVPYPSYPDRSVPLIVAIGIVYGLVATVIGLVVYCKRQGKWN